MSGMILESRMALAELFGAPTPNHVVFTSGATESLNMAIHGLVEDGCHVLATSLEHNAMARPLHLLRQKGVIDVTWIDCDRDGEFCPEAILPALRPNTRMLVMPHASNVIGNQLPVSKSFAIAKRHGLFTILDAAQTAGHMDVRLDGNTDVIAFTGHKGLRGVGGTGGLVLGKDAASKMRVWKAGGTGSFSHSLESPGFLPDKFEPGTPNTLGIIGLGAAAAAIAATGFDAIRNHEKTVTNRFVEGLKQLPIVLYGKYDREKWLPVVSLNIPEMDAGVLARRLLDEFEIETRSGLHCSPLAHKTIDTFPHGAVRFSFGMVTTIQEVDYVLDALTTICERRTTP